MSRPLHRGVSIRIPDSNNNDLWDSQSKDKTEKEGLDRRGSFGHPSPLRSPFKLLFSDNSNSKYGIGENGFSSDPFIIGTPRSRHKLVLLFLKFSLVFIVILALAGSFWWTISISTASRGHIYHGYRRLQENLVSDLLDIGEISYAPSRLKELEFCSEEFENYVPCFNVSDNLALGFSDGNEFDRQCHHELRPNCLVLSPPNYKIPLRWPTGRDIIWIANAKITAQEVLSSGSFTKRMMMLDEEQISFRSASLMFDGVEDYSHQIAEMIGLRNESSFIQAGVRTILDIGCGYGSFGAHLFQSQLLTMCIASYEPSGSQVQLTLERGLPAMVASFTSKQLPYPSLSFDMLHCARCGIDWDRKDGILMIEADRLLRPGGYFVWTSPLTNARDKDSQKRWKFIQSFAENLCWDMLSQQDETVVWKKTSKRNCYSSRKNSSPPPLCGRGYDVESPYYRELQNCIGGTHSSRWISVQERETWPSRDHLNKKELAIFGLQSDEFAEDSESWKAAVRNYWSLLSPLIFSDHPKRPGDEDPPPPYNMLRNVLDMNAHVGGFNSAMLQAGKSIWVMNVVPLSGLNYLPLIQDRLAQTQNKQIPHGTLLEPPDFVCSPLSLHFLCSTTDSTKTPQHTLLMLNDQTPSTSHGTEQHHNESAENEPQIREIYALTPPPRREPNFETHTHSHSHDSSSVSIEGGSSENFSMSREFSALVLAGSSIENNITTPSQMSLNTMHGNEEGVNSYTNSNNNYNNNNNINNNSYNNLGRIGEDEMLMMEETNPLAIVADINPLEAVSSSSPPRRGGGTSSGSGGALNEVTVQRVRKEEVEAKISAWQNAKVAKINNRFKREDAVINGWENEQVQKASSWMKKVERKLEEKRARALEKMQNDVAKAHRKAEERRASAEAKRGTKVARVLEIANLMRAVGRAPTKRSFF